MTLLPPPQYTLAPTIPVIEHVMTQAEVDAACHRIMPAAFAAIGTTHADGCSRKLADKCLVWRVDREAVRIHERAHCAGWPPNHPGAR